MRSWNFLDLARAVLELLASRIALARMSGAPSLDPPAAMPPGHIAAVDERKVRLVAYLIPRVAARLPWRADCLVQALAARRWLGSCGIPTQLSIGMRQAAGGLEAHAWLTWCEIIVTGGDVSDYAPLRRD